MPHRFDSWLLKLRDGIAVIALILPFLAQLGHAQQAAEPNRAEELFVRRVLPLVSQSCWSCHGEQPGAIQVEVQGELNLTTRAKMIEGGASGEPAIRPGDATRSPLLLAVMREHESWPAMPPKDSQRLTGQQIDGLREWIDAGAPWPDAQRQQEISRTRAAAWATEDGILVSTSGGLSAEWTNRRYQPAGLWAYRPLNAALVPATLRSPTDSTAIDQFLERGWSAELQPAAAADARTFLRRATLDLTGLPPSFEELEDFARQYAIDADDAVARCIDRLLASPHYGERMAQHWLDVVRYADSSGLSNDYARGNAWRYRDYVVRSFNNDKPYDLFVMEQIAGDEMLAEDPGTSTPPLGQLARASDKLIAMGYLRMGAWELTGMEVVRVARQRFLDDVTSSVGETFLGQALQCARCHDHKFDPIPTRDYYAIQAVFSDTQLVDRPAAFMPVENTTGFEEVRYLEQSRDELRSIMDALDAKSLAAAERWLSDHQLDSATWHAAVKQASASGPARRRGVFGAARNVMLQDGVPQDQIPPRMLGWSPADIGMERIANKGLERITWEMDRYKSFALSVFNGPTPTASTVTSPIRLPNVVVRRATADPTHILTGGDPFSEGDEVKPRALSAVESLTGLPAILPDSFEGRRLALARWITDRRNPLTPRVIVNRLWLWHFDIPLAGNPNNFGSTGKQPTHPELLDWLALKLIENDWSIKSIHRLIMNSHAYRRSTQVSDPANVTNNEALVNQYAVFKPRRLTSEEIRDCMLSASGELSASIGGLPVRPEINSAAAMQPRQVMGTFAAAWVPSPLPEQRHRRTFYALKLRGLVDPALEGFNSPAADFSCERREVSIVTPQVFALFNSDSSQLRSIAMARRVLTTGGDDGQCIDQCFQIALGRLPTIDERDQCLDHWRAMQSRHQTLHFEKRLVPSEVRRDAVEENTGERFSYVEKLFSNKDFVPDLQPSDCDARTRALADLCLVLLNTNEFMYVY